MAQAEPNTKQIRNSLGETQVIAVVFWFVCFFNISPGDSQCLAKFENQCLLYFRVHGNHLDILFKQILSQCGVRLEILTLLESFWVCPRLLLCSRYLSVRYCCSRTFQETNSLRRTMQIVECSLLHWRAQGRISSQPRTSTSFCENLIYPKCTCPNPPPQIP